MTPLDQQTISDLSRFGLNADDRADKFASAFDAQSPLEELPTFAPLAERTDRQVLDSLENILLDGLDVWRKILEALGSSSDSRSSVELKVSSARKEPDPTVKIYQGSPVDGLVEIALDTFGRLKREADARSLNGWQETADELSKRKAG